MSLYEDWCLYTKNVQSPQPFVDAAFYFMIGALAMWFFSFDWSDKIVVLGRMGVVSVTCTLLLWQVVKRRLRPVSG